MKWVGNTKSYKKNKNMIFHNMESGQIDKIEIKEERLQEKEFAMLGFHFSDVKNSSHIAYTRNSRKLPEDLLEYREFSSMKLKYKNEPMYNVINVYTNFYPTAIASGGNKDDYKVKFDLKKSHYTSKYWENPNFPDMQNVINPFLKGTLKEKQNINSIDIKKYFRLF
jgi:hypothetical protein